MWLAVNSEIIFRRLDKYDSNKSCGKWGGFNSLNILGGMAGVLAV